MARSKKGTINWRDIVHSLIIAVSTPIVLGLIEVFNGGVLPDWATLKLLLISGIGAGLAYIAKQFLTSEHGTIFNKRI